MSNTVYQQVTDRIIEQLEKGALPWIKPWRSDSTADKNFITQKPYSGINTLILGMSGFSNPAWATYQQWQSKNIQVKKGEKSTQIVFFKPIKATKENASGETESANYSVLRAYHVFNAEQTDADILPSVSDELLPFNPIPACENKITETGAIINHGGDGAFYMPSKDQIQLPNKTAFNSESNYYATAFHELAHWSGAKHRLDRDLSGKYGNPAYAFEELIAEISAAFLCAEFKIEGELRHAGYIESWLKACRDDNKAIFKAAALAQKAADYIKALNVNQLPETLAA
jgi:antirestriction protein ArdC